MKSTLISIIAFLLPAIAFAQGISTLPQFVSTTSPSSAITQTTYGKAIRITGLTPGANLCLDGSGLVTTSGCTSGGSGGGSGTVSTSTHELAGQLAYWTSNSGTPALLGQIATGTLSATSPLSVTANRYVLGGSAALSIDTSGTWSGNAVTASALAANGANCSAGNAPLGVDASGAAESCFDVWTQAENTSAAYISLASLSSANLLLNYNPSTGVFTASTTPTYSSSTSTNATSTAFFAQTASTSNLFLSTSACSGSSALQVTSAGLVSCGAVSASGGVGSWFVGQAFGAATNPSATSTLTIFNVGLASLASTTIGGGTVSNGLTIAGFGTSTNFIITNNATSTFATSTNFFATNASSTNEFTSNLNFTLATGTSATTTNLTVTGQASTSALTISKLGNSTQCLHVSSSGAVTGTGSDCGSGGASFGQSMEINSSFWVSPTTTNTYGINTNPSGITYGYAIGNSLLAYSSSTNQDTIFGLGAGGQAATTSATVVGLTVFGFGAGKAITTTSGNNTLLGYLAGAKLSTGVRNTVVGSSNIAVTTGSDNTLVGSGAMVNGSTGAARNIGIGSGALNAQNGIANDNIQIGVMKNAIDVRGSGNILIGNDVVAPSVTGNAQLNIANTLYGTSIFNDGSVATSPNPAANASIGIGSTTPFAKLSVHGNTNDSGINFLFMVASSTPTATTTLWALTNTGHTIGSSTQPVLSSCGTSPTQTGDDRHGEVIPGATATGCTLTFAKPYSVAPICVISDQSMSVVNPLTYTISATALVMSMTGIDGDKVDYICEGLTGTQ